MLSNILAAPPNLQGDSKGKSKVPPMEKAFPSFQKPRLGGKGPHKKIHPNYGSWGGRNAHAWEIVRAWRTQAPKGLPSVPSWLDHWVPARWQQLNSLVLDKAGCRQDQESQVSWEATYHVISSSLGSLPITTTVIGWLLLWPHFILTQPPLYQLLD